jgi:hypothetical protein
MDVVANYMFGSSFVYHTLHFEGEEVFEFAKRPANYSPSADNDSHRLDHVNFFCPRVIVPTAQPNVIGNVGMQQSPCFSSACLPLVS